LEIARATGPIRLRLALKLNKYAFRNPERILMGAGTLLSTCVLDGGSIGLSALALLGVVTGIVLFFRGFRMLQYKRLILNTPLSKIRSASMGLVEVTGMPTGPKTISSAITGAPCYYYRARAWQWLDSGKGGSWQQAVDESVFVPFFLQDSTGKVLVNPQGATLDVHRSFHDEIRTSSINDRAIPESIRKFVAISGLIAGDKVRLEEYIIKPGYPLFVFGTLGENSMLNSWNAQPHAMGKKVSFGLSFGNPSGLKFSYGTNVSGVAAKAIAGLLERVPSTKKNFTIMTRSDGGPVELPGGILETFKQAGVTLPDSMQGESAKMTISNSTGLGGTLVANVTRTAIASRQVPAAAAPTQNRARPDPVADPFDLHSRVAINQGERGDPFTISSQSQREVVRSLAWKSMLYIWGSPVFTLVCIYFLFVYWGWL
jgi:hypothetical protein